MLSLTRRFFAAFAARLRHVRAKLADTVKKYANITAQTDHPKTLVDPVHGRLWRRRQKSRGNTVAAANRNQFVHCGEKPRVFKLCRDAHGDGEIVMSYPGNIHAGYGDDLLQILKGFFRFQQQDDGNLLIRLAKKSAFPAR